MALVLCRFEAVLAVVEERRLTDVRSDSRRSTVGSDGTSNIQHSLDGSTRDKDNEQFCTLLREAITGVSYLCIYIYCT